MKIYSFGKCRHGIQVWREDSRNLRHVHPNFDDGEEIIVRQYLIKNFLGTEIKSHGLGNFEAEVYLVFNDKADEAYYLLLAYDGIEI